MSIKTPMKFVFKVIVIGDGAVGKTCLTLTFVKKEFKTDYIPTLGVDIYTKDFKLGDSEITLIIWDIAGQEKFDILRKQYYKGTQGALLAFDLTREDTFHNIEDWYNELIEYSGEKIPLIILGNKSDLVSEKTVEDNKIKLLCKKLDSEYFETSAKTGKNVEKAFFTLLKKIIQLNLSRR